MGLDSICGKVFLKEQGKLFPKPVAETLEEAIEIAKKSDFVKSIINANTLDSFFRSLEEDIVDYYDPNKNFKRWITF